MIYIPSFAPICEKQINKATRKNPVLRKILDNKIREILINPYHFKPFKYDLAGERSVHIMKSFVLKLTIDEQKKRVVFIFFGHHDRAY